MTTIVHSINGKIYTDDAFIQQAQESSAVLGNLKTYKGQMFGLFNEQKKFVPLAFITTSGITLRDDELNALSPVLKLISDAEKEGSEVIGFGDIVAKLVDTREVVIATKKNIWYFSSVNKSIYGQPYSKNNFTLGSGSDFAQLYLLAGKPVDEIMGFVSKYDHLSSSVTYEIDFRSSLTDIGSVDIELVNDTVVIVKKTKKEK